MAATVAAALALAGCGATAARRALRHPPSSVERAQAIHEYPSSRPPRQRASGASATPTSAVAAFVSGYINWNAGSVAADMRALAARSVGQARAATELAAAETAGDYELQRGGVANSGTIEAISPLAGHAGQFVIVTRELTTATATTAYQGLAPAWHVAIASVSELDGRWVVSGWQPQS
ncbi:MAG TPA: hypothetical protein VGI50_04770 [Solirubrobacteraceae bacterium]